MTNLSSNMRFTFHFRQLNATSHTAFSANLDSSVFHAYHLTS